MVSAILFQGRLSLLLFALTRVLPSLGALALLLTTAKSLGPELGGELAAWIIAVNFTAILGRFGADRMVQRLHATNKKVPIKYLAFVFLFASLVAFLYVAYADFKDQREVFVTFFVIILCSLLYVAQALMRSAGYKYISGLFDPGVPFLLSALLMFLSAELYSKILVPYYVVLFSLAFTMCAFILLVKQWKDRVSYVGWPKGAISLFISTLSGQGAKSGFWLIVSFVATGAALYNLNVAYRYAQLGNFLLSIANQRWYPRYTADVKGLRFATKVGVWLGLISLSGYMVLFVVVFNFGIGIEDRYSLFIFSFAVLIHNFFGPMGFYLSMIGREKVNIVANALAFLLVLISFFVMNAGPGTVPFVYLFMVLLSNVFQSFMARKYILSVVRS